MTIKLSRTLVLVGLLASSLTALATIFGSVSGLIHDPQHRPVQGAQVTLRAANSDWTKTVASNDDGEFRFDTVPLGEYVVRVEQPGFASEEQKLVLNSGREARTHFSLTVAQAKETVEVKDTSDGDQHRIFFHLHPGELDGRLRRLRAPIRPTA